MSCSKFISSWVGIILVDILYSIREQQFNFKGFADKIQHDAVNSRVEAYHSVNLNIVGADSFYSCQVMTHVIVCSPLTFDSGQILTVE